MTTDMPRMLAGLLLVGSITGCDWSVKPENCARFRTGHFRYQRFEPFRYAARIDRNDSIQTETDELTGAVSKLRVRWTDDCHYELRFISSTQQLPDSIQQYRTAMPLQTEIIQATDRYYLFTSFREKGGLALTDTMWVR